MFDNNQRPNHVLRQERRKPLTMPIRPIAPSRLPSRLQIGGALLALSCLLLLAVGYGAPMRMAGGPPAAILLTPTVIAAYRASVDQRDIDTYPALAYDAASGRYLAVWLTLRNATATNVGLDVYGRFLDRNGTPMGAQFRISDAGSAARSNAPTVTVGGDGFLVAWTTRGAICQLSVQPVTDTSPQPDHILPLASETHMHSPQLVYHAQRQRYVITYSSGDDYLPPMLWDTNMADVADCGNNAASNSEVRATEFDVVNGLPIVDSTVTLSAGQGGAFRPAIAYSAGLDQYAVVWEDRRNAATEAYAFDVYAQRLSAELNRTAENVNLATGNYANLDNSATWTPRPIIAASNAGFLATWFERTVAGDATIWRVQSRLLAATGMPGTPFTVMRMSFAQPHPGDAPTGFLGSAYLDALQEFLVTASSHQETLAGYFSAARVQRVATTGDLLNLDGTPRLTPGLGNRIDAANDIQLAVALAADNTNGDNRYLVGYSKHAPDGHSQDFDIWGMTIRLDTPQVTHTPTPTLIPTTEDPTLAPSPTATAIPLTTITPTLMPQATATPYALYFPVVWQ